ncbi:MAG: HAD-IC family P-type ATPase [Microthrixaceae bacterium]|nr:HAD-IC family P-type ATPase [Microthrixaceae bacterium]
MSAEEVESLGDRDNCGFMNTTVVRGRGDLVVVATGMSTEVGRLAGMLAEAPQQLTPLQRQLDALGKRLAAIAVVAVLVVFALAILQGEDLEEAMIESVALAVAAIPEGLPAVVTVTLALGVSRMAEQNAIVKRLASVETLGSTTAICSDKTGTLTLNQMTAVKVITGSGRFDVSGLGYGIVGSVADTPDTDGFPASTVAAGDPGGSGERRHRDASIALGALCNDAEVRFDGDGEAVEVVGDPTEVALVVLAAKVGVDVASLRRSRPRMAEVPFDSTKKFMATLHQHPDDTDRSQLVVKGAPDVVLDRCVALGVGATAVELDERLRGRVMEENSALGSAGLRVLAVASRSLPVRASEFEADLAAEVGDLELEVPRGHPRPAPARGGGGGRALPRRRDRGEDDHRGPRDHRGCDRSGVGNPR